MKSTKKLKLLHRAKRTASLMLCVAVLCGTVSGCGPLQKTPEEKRTWASGLSITPSAERDGLIALDATFLVTSSEKLSKKEVESLTVTPKTEFTVEKQGEGFLIKPVLALLENTIINIEVRDEVLGRVRSWAFQTETGFTVLSSHPDDGSGYVPVDSGVEVLLSSPDVSEDAFLKSFSLINKDTKQAVPGSLKQFGQTFVFAPQSELSMATIYEAKVAGSLSTLGGRTLGEEYTFSFRTADEKGGYFENASPICETFLKESTPLIAVNCESTYLKNAAPLTVFSWRFPTAESYQETLLAYAKKRGEGYFFNNARPDVDTEKLQSLGSFTTTFSGNEDKYGGSSYILLPEDYDYGWYYFLVKTISPDTGKEMVLDKFIQISDISVYTMHTEGESLYWLHDAKTGAPLVNATVDIKGEGISASGSSDNNGTVQLRAPFPGEEERGWAVARITSGDTVFLDIMQQNSAHRQSAQERYSAYLYSDRPVYQPTDTVRLWGVVRPREGVFGMPENLHVTLGDYDNTLYSVPVTPKQDGTFTAEVSFEKLAGRQISYESLYLKCGEETLASKSISIGEFVKPDYLPSVSTDKEVYRVGESAKITFSASFFDGTPAHGFKASVRTDRSEEDESILITGEDGTASRTIKLLETPEWSLKESMQWRAVSLGYNISNASAENENFYLYGSIPVFYKDTAVRAEVSGTGAAQKLTVKTNRITLENIKQASDAYDEEKIIGVPVDLPVTAETHKVYYTKTPSDSYYDFVQKKNVMIYDYEQHDEVQETKLYETKNGLFEITDLPSGEEEYYYVKLRTRDSAGKEIEEIVWISAENGYRYRSEEPRYTFDKRGAGDDYTKRMQFGDLENVTFDVQNNRQPVKSGNILYAIVQDGIKKVSLSPMPVADVPFKESLVPNYILVGAYFDGKYIYEIEKLYMRFDPRQRELAISLTADKESYAPGENANLTLDVTYKDSAKPVENAAVSLSLVDEAVFAIEEDSADILQSLYQSVYSPSIWVEASYRVYTNPGTGGAEKGGGGGDFELRDDFKDTAAFVTLTTDSQGRAKTELELPDNITSWRATVQGVSSDLYAGTATAPVVVTGDFFLNALLPETFLEGDNASLSLRAYGEAEGFTAESPVDYTVTLNREGEVTQHAATGKAGDYTVLPLGPLERGEYTVIMTAKTPNILLSAEQYYQDAVEKSITVKSGGVEASLVKTFDVSQGIDIEPERFPVTMGFYNAEYAFYSQVLESVTGAMGGRVDERIARRYSREQIAALSGEEPKVQNVSDDLGDVIDPSGYVSLFSYATPSVPLSAKVHLAVPDYLTGAKPYSVFTSTLGSTGEPRGDIAAAYLGLAAHRQPVLDKVRAALAQGGYSDEEQLWLVAALAAIGDFETAQNKYDELLTPLLTDGVSAQQEPTRFIKQGSVNDSLRLTALASLTASQLGLADADGMMRYLMDNSSTMDLYLLEKIVYLEHMRPLGGQASVSYTVLGKRKTVDLAMSGMSFAQFTAEDFAMANIKPAKGSVFAKAYYVGGAAEASKQENREITLTRTIEPRDGTQIAMGDVVKITLTPVMNDNIDPSGLCIDDYIPSGMRYLSIGADDQDAPGKANWTLSNREGQKVSFVYYMPEARVVNEDGQETLEPVEGQQKFQAPPKLVYYARCATPGDYVVESAYVRAAATPVWGFSERANVKIHE